MVLLAIAWYLDFALDLDTNSCFSVSPNYHLQTYCGSVIRW